MAYFDTTRTLRRFDALGGATALFFLTENDALATVTSSSWTVPSSRHAT